MKIENLQRLYAKVRSIPKKARPLVKTAISDSANEITAFQRNAVPHHLGTLRDSIRWQFGSPGAKGDAVGDLSATIRAGGPTTTHTIKAGKGKFQYDYGFAQEFGTKKMKANPFFYPGVRLHKKRAKARIARAVNKALKDLKA